MYRLFHLFTVFIEVSVFACASCIDFESVSTIFRLDFRNVLRVWFSPSFYPIRETVVTVFIASVSIVYTIILKRVVCLNLIPTFFLLNMAFSLLTFYVSCNIPYDL
jgi:hypothetical protein